MVDYEAKAFVVAPGFSQEQIHILMQLALRESIGKYRLDETLDNKQEISDYVFKTIKAKEEDYYITFFDAGVKKIILPGEVREIMNSVLLAEKAQNGKC